ncbi:MAG: hypothetical protein K0U52_02305 [Gammaproteobacteria bacterium]|nr:hypothetical protein [Gammaproteobacteria bacterium]
MLKKIISNKGNAIESVEKLSNIADKWVDGKDDKRDFYEDILERDQEDKDAARELFKETTQKVLHYLIAGAIVFGFIYTLMVMLPAIIEGKLENVSALGAGILGTLITLVATNISSVRDFLFGSSDSEREVAKSLTQAKNPADRGNQRHERKMARLENKKK